MVYVVTATVNEGEVKDFDVMKQKGEYYDSRMKEGILYLITDNAIYANSFDSVDDVIGMVDGKKIEPENTFYTSIDEYHNDYFIMSSVDITAGAEVLDSKAYIGESIELYVSADFIYFLESESYGERTNIVRFSFDNGNINPTVSGHVDGWVNNSFSADEYNGYLRIVTTQYSGNNLYVLDEKLEIVGSITGLAEGEEIKSARFMGDTGYFVTYRNTDPLFTVDLSEPSKPKLMDELKITGYSSYLHFMDEDNLLGIGYESNPDTGIKTGIKVTLFDVADKSDVKVKNNLQYEGETLYSEAILNHKAVMTSESKGIYGFCMYSYDYAPVIDEEWNEVDVNCEVTYQYKVFLYKDGDIREVESIEKTEADDYAIRGLYIGDYFYLISGDKAYVYNLDEVVSDNTATELLSISY